MTVKFEYKCNECGFDYLEQRGKDEPQIFVKCTFCKEGDFVETNQTILSDHIERQPAGEAEEQTND
jgi:uncharacterized protein (DUF983 family)